MCQVVFRLNFDTPKRTTLLRDNWKPHKEKYFHEEIKKLSKMNSKVNQIKSAPGFFNYKKRNLEVKRNR